MLIEYDFWIILLCRDGRRQKKYDKGRDANGSHPDRGRNTEKADAGLYVSYPEFTFGRIC